MALSFVDAALVDLLFPIPPVATREAGLFEAPLFDNPSRVKDANIGWTVVTRAGIEALRTLLNTEMARTAAHQQVIDTQRALLTLIYDSVNYGLGRPNDYLRLDDFSYYSPIDTMLEGPFGPTGTDVEVASWMKPVTDWLTFMPAVGTTPAADDNVLRLADDPANPNTWLDNPHLVNSVWWKMLGSLARCTAGQSEAGGQVTVSGVTKIQPLVVWEQTLRAVLYGIDLNRMPIVLTDDGHAYLCLAQPLKLGDIIALCELQLWERDPSTFTGTAIAPADIEQWLTPDLPVLTRSTQWLLKRDPLTIENFAGLVFSAVDLSATDLPTSRSGHSIRRIGGANVGYFWFYNGSTNQVDRFSTLTLKRMVRTNRPTVTQNGSWAVNTVPDEYYTWSEDGTTDFPGMDSTSGLTWTGWLSLAFPYCYGANDAVDDGGDWRESVTNGEWGLMVNGRVANLQWPYADSYPESPLPIGATPIDGYRHRGQYYAMVTDLVDTAPGTVRDSAPVWGMWPLRHVFLPQLYRNDDATNGDGFETTYFFDVTHNRTPTSFTTPYKRITGSNTSTSGAGYAALALPSVPSTSGSGPGSGTGSNQDLYLEFTQASSFGTERTQILLAQMLYQREAIIVSGSGTISDPFVYGFQHDYSYETEAMMVAGSSWNIFSGGSTHLKTDGIASGSTWTITNSDFWTGNPLSTPTIQEIIYRDALNAYAHISAVHWDSVGGPVSGTVTITANAEYVLRNQLSGAETVLITHALSLAVEANAPSQLIKLFGSDFNRKVDAISLGSLPSEWGIYLRLSNVTWDHTLPVTPSVSNAGTVFQTGRFEFYIRLNSTQTNSVGNHIYIDAPGNTGVACDSWLGTEETVGGFQWNYPIDTVTWTTTGGFVGVGGSVSGTTAASVATISGTPTSANAPGKYHVKQHAAPGTTLSAGDSYQFFDLRSAWSPSASLSTTTLQVGRQGVLHLNVFNNAGAFKFAAARVEADGLPPGMTCDATTGVVSGVPTLAGQYRIHYAAVFDKREFGGSKLDRQFVDGTEASRQIFSTTLIVNVLDTDAAALGERIMIRSARKATCYAGLPFSYTIVAYGEPDLFAATGLPAGLSINTATGEISGTVTATAEAYYDVTITASRTGTALTQSLTLRLQVLPMIAGQEKFSAQVGVAFRQRVQLFAADHAVSYSASGMPAGLSIDASTGWITGTPTGAGTSTVTISVTDTTTTRSQTITILVNSASASVPTINYGSIDPVIQIGAAISCSAAVSPSKIGFPDTSGFSVPISRLVSGRPTGSVASGATGTCSVFTPSGTTTVTFYNNSTASVGVIDTVYLLVYDDFTAQTLSSLPGLTGTQTCYLGMTVLPYRGEDRATLGINAYFTMDPADFFGGHATYASGYPHDPSIVLQTAVSTTDADRVLYCWFNDEPLHRTSPGGMPYIAWTPGNLPFRTF